MNNLENFHANESTEGLDNGAFERLKEKMAQSRAQIKKDQKQEASQVKKDDVLFNVLIEFIKHFPSNHPVVKGIVACLSANIPSLIILAVISLNYKSIEKAVPTIPESNSLIQASSLDIPNIQKLISWIQRLHFTLLNTKEADLRKVYPDEILNKYLKGLIVHSLTDYFKTIPLEELPVDNIEGYVESILGQISYNKVLNKLDEPN
jgi:hypothetical protein